MHVFEQPSLESANQSINQYFTVADCWYVDLLYIKGTTCEIGNAFSSQFSTKALSKVLMST